MNPISSRLLNQQLICPQFHRPVDVVSWMGAMQAQDYQSVRWAVAMRTRKPSFKAFEDDFNSGRIVRTHLLRCTWQLVAGEDLAWILALCAGKAKSTMKGWMTSNGVKITEEEENRISDIFEEYLAEERCATKDDFVKALAEKDIKMDDHRLSYHIRLAELSGRLCSGDLRPQKSTYSLVRGKIGNMQTLHGEEALGRLATKYFQSHSPATLEDFAWWSGLNLATCREALRLLESSLQCEKFKGRDFYVLNSCRTRGFRSGTVHLIPPYDEYLIAYKSRDIVLEPAMSHKAHNNSGIFKPIVALDGEIVGNWSPTAQDGRIEIFKEGVSIPQKELSLQFRNFITAKNS